MTSSETVVVFRVGGHRFGIAPGTVERVVPAVRVTPLPKAPPIVSGLINVAGDVVPVIDMRRRSGIAERPLRSSDVLILAHSTRRRVALMADEVEGLIAVPEEDFAPGEAVLPGVPGIGGVVKHRGGLIVIHDLERFLSLEEERSLETALQEQEV